jgi:MFS family permease
MTANGRGDALDPVADPGGAAFGATGAEASVDLRWLALVGRRVQCRAMASPRYPWWVLIALLAGLFALNFTFTVFVVALPSVARQFNTNFSVLTWVSIGPLLAFGLAAPIFGKAGDLFGYRRLYLIGLAGAMVAAVCTALAPSVGLLIFARSLDGVQGAATGTASMALILRMFAPEDRVKAMGWWSMIGAGGPVIGVSVGSPIIQYFGWRNLFWVQLVLLIVAFAVVVLVLPAHRFEGSPDAVGAAGSDMGARAGGGGEAGTVGGAVPSRGGRWAGTDWVGSWSLSAGVTGAMLVLSVGPIIGWTSPMAIVSGSLAVAAVGTFVLRELTSASPLIPKRYFARRNFSFPMGLRAFLMFAYFGAFFLFPLMMEQVYGWSESRAGFVSAIRPLVFAVSSPVAGYLTTRIGERMAAAIGTAAVVLSMAMFATFGPHPHFWFIAVALGLSGLSMGVALPATSSIQSNEVDPREYGVMSAAQLLAAQVGEVAGIQVMITIEESAVRTAGLSAVHHGLTLLPAFREAFWVGTCVAVGSLVCAIFIRSMDRTRRLAT